MPQMAPLNWSLLFLFFLLVFLLFNIKNFYMFYYTPNKILQSHKKITKYSWKW